MCLSVTKSEGNRELKRKGDHETGCKRGVRRGMNGRKGYWVKARPKQCRVHGLQWVNASMATEGTSQSEEKRHVLRPKTLSPVK